MVLEKINWKDHVRNEEVLHRVKKGKVIVKNENRMKCLLLEHDIEGKREDRSDRKDEEDVTSY